MSNNYLDQKNLARLAEINKTQTKQMEQFLSMNPNFQNRFEAINNMYSNLPLDIVIDLSMFSEQELPIESESIVTLNNTIIEEQAIQAANDYQQSKEDYRDKDYADNMTMNYLDVLSFGAVLSSLYWAQRIRTGFNKDKSLIWVRLKNLLKSTPKTMMAFGKDLLKKSRVTIIKRI